jgi:Tfp pilus assembly protein PilF
MQKRIIVLFLAAITIFVVLTGCGSTDKTSNTEEQASDASTASKALENGKLAFADGDYSKAKSNFELALSEDKENQEAKEWLPVVEDMELLSNFLTNKV